MTKMEKKNYQLMLDKKIDELVKSGTRPRLLLHSCCAPCSSYVLEYLSKYMDITCYYYNPNISPAAEFHLRAEELQRLIEEMPADNPIELAVGRYDPAEFASIAKGKEHLPEGGERCTDCFRLRLAESAKYAKDGQFDYFTTTLSISPYKNCEWLNEIGAECAEKHNLKYLL